MTDLIATKEVTISEVDPSDGELLRQIGRLRIRAWATLIPEASDLEEWLDEFDFTARHWVARKDGELVAAARMTVHSSTEGLPDRESYPEDLLRSLPTPIGSFNRLVVDQSARGLGIGGRLDSLRLDEAERIGCRCVVGATPSGDSRIRQLESIGFRAVGLSGGYQQGPFAFRPTANEAVLVCYLPRSR